MCDNCVKAGTHCRVCRSYSGKCVRCAIQKIPCLRDIEVPQFGVDMGNMPNGASFISSFPSPFFMFCDFFKPIFDDFTRSRLVSTRSPAPLEVSAINISKRSKRWRFKWRPFWSSSTILYLWVMLMVTRTWEISRMMRQRRGVQAPLHKCAVLMPFLNLDLKIFCILYAPSGNFTLILCMYRL